MLAKNGIFNAELKPPQGKLLRCTLTLKDGIIDSVQFTGDFFLMPEDVVAKLESELEGLSIDEVAARIQGFFSAANVEMLGVAPEHFIAIIERMLTKS